MEKGGYSMKVVTDTLEVARSNQYERQKKEAKKRRRYQAKVGDERYLGRIREIIDKRPTYGYRRVTAVLNRFEGSAVNHKRIYRIMRVNGLLLQKHTGKPVRTHDGKVVTLKSNLRWCSDGMEIRCWNGDRIRLIFALDCCDREAMSYLATTGGISGEMVRDLMAEAVEVRFGPVLILPYTVQWLSDNGPAYTALETREFGKMIGLDICTTPFYSPESNGIAESFIKTFKRDYIGVHELWDAHLVLEQLPFWFEDYNENHPHKGLKMKSPREFRREENKLEVCPV
jgi:transposase InsO family protein